jgi:hypothetical protein
MLRIVGYSRSREFLERLSPLSPTRSVGSDPLEAERIARAIAIAGRHGLVKAECLPQSLLLMFILRRRGLSPALKFGVRKSGAIVDAHCWIELDGRALAHGQKDFLEFSQEDAASILRSSSS